MALKQLTDILVNLDADEIVNAVKTELDAGTAPKDILAALTKGMNEVGNLYEQKEYYLTELVLAGEMMKDVMEVLQPHLKTDEVQTKGTVILATVEGDNHDIGKNILKTLLISAGYTVLDLGKDVSVNKIVEKVKASNAPVVGLSSLLTMTVNEISLVDKALKAAGLRDQTRLIVGGAPLSMELARKLGADDFAADAVDGVRKINELMGI